MNRFTTILNQFSCESYHILHESIHQNLWLSLNRFIQDMNRINQLSRSFESFHFSLDSYHSSSQFYFLMFCLIWFKSIHSVINLIHSVVFVRKFSLITLLYNILLLITPNLLNHLQLFSLGLKNSLFIHSSILNSFSSNHFVLWVYRFSRVLVGIVSWFSQKDWLGLIKVSKEVNNLIPPPKDSGVFLTVLEVKRSSFTGRSIEGLSEEFEGVHG